MTKTAMVIPHPKSFLKPVLLHFFLDSLIAESKPPPPPPSLEDDFLHLLHGRWIHQISSKNIELQKYFPSFFNVFFGKRCLNSFLRIPSVIIRVDPGQKFFFCRRSETLIFKEFFLSNEFLFFICMSCNSGTLLSLGFIYFYLEKNKTTVLLSFKRLSLEERRRKDKVKPTGTGVFSFLWLGS